MISRFVFRERYHTANMSAAGTRLVSGLVDVASHPFNFVKTSSRPCGFVKAQIVAHRPALWHSIHNSTKVGSYHILQTIKNGGSPSVHAGVYTAEACAFCSVMPRQIYLSASPRSSVSRRTNKECCSIHQLCQGHCQKFIRSMQLNH